MVVWAAAVLLAHAPAIAAEASAVLTDYSISSWTYQDGAPSGSISALAQDRDGFLWLGTDGGLVRFDGTRFRTWQELGGAALGDRSVQALWAARDGSLWVGLGGDVGSGAFAGST